MDNGANVNIKDDNGYTPIDFAREYKSIKIVKFFEEYCRNNKIKIEPKTRYQTRRAIDELSKELNLPNEKWMQD
jgi:ankyrin repeat protein